MEPNDILQTWRNAQNDLLHECKQSNQIIGRAQALSNQIASKVRFARDFIEPGSLIKTRLDELDELLRDLLTVLHDD